jgi:PIN domain nuclease of toxin-antitoxin system
VSTSALLDTHTLLWFDLTPWILPDKVRLLLRDRRTHVYVSAMSAFEIAIKYRIGQLPEAEPLLMDYHETLARYGFSELPFTSVHTLAAAELRNPHKDPFDRALVAQALSEQLVLVSGDEAMRGFARVKVVW